MDPQPQVVLANFPVWTMYVIAIAQIVFALAMAAIGIVMLKLVGQILMTLNEVHSMVADDVHKQIMPEVVATMKNVKSMSDDARVTTHNVTGTVNRVSHVVGTVASRAESPLVRSIGLLTGLAAGAKALGGRKREDVEEKKGGRRGLFGR